MFQRGYGVWVRGNLLCKANMSVQRIVQRASPPMKAATTSMELIPKDPPKYLSIYQSIYICIYIGVYIYTCIYIYVQIEGFRV